MIGSATGGTSHDSWWRSSSSMVERALGDWLPHGDKHIWMYGFWVIGLEMELVGRESGRIGQAKMCLRGVVVCIWRSQDYEFQCPDIAH